MYISRGSKRVIFKARREMWETEDDISNYPGLQRRTVPPEMS